MRIAQQSATSTEYFLTKFILSVRRRTLSSVRQLVDETGGACPSPARGAFEGGGTVFEICHPNGENDKISNMVIDETIQKVIRAMLGMQRRAWEQGVAAQALLELGETERVLLLAKDAVVNQWKDGRLGLLGQDRPVADPAANGEPVLFAARVTGDGVLKEAAERALDFLLYRAPRTREGIIFHNFIENTIWVDSFYMVPPFLAVAGHPAEAVKQIVGYRNILWNPKKCLYSHIWDDDRKQFVREVFWGVGNGWAAAGMTRVIQTLPDSMKPEKEMIAGFVKEVIDGCLKYQRPDGLFHDVLDDPATFVETNAAQMLAYAIFRGVHRGSLDQGYLAPAQKMREAAHAKVDEFGLVQGVCGAPNFDRPGTATEGQAFFLLMEAAYTGLSSRSPY